ncbi:FixH family protein [Oceanobacillus manasiensis]|uniref:FixH family protein n=1 Tax=Oceanobacillus manasiensis TaxID=586413 RepID=UPI0005A7A839|nr:FixH family protein [Oceanobacillus manasiensis]
MKKLIGFALFFVLAMLVACGGKGNTNEAETMEEPAILEVDFSVPETADTNETVELKATVTYGEEDVKDADKVLFELWEKGKKDESWEVESTNNEDGTYTAETSFEKDGVYEMYAHTDARELHTMPKKKITVGSGEAVIDSEEESEHEDNHEHHHGETAKGFSMHFAHPEGVKAKQEVELVSHLQMDEEPMEEARVRYELWLDGSDKHDWVDVEENNPGEYSATHSFGEKGLYHVVVHVENNDGLHEHEEYEINVE